MNFMFPNSDHKLFRDKLTGNLFCTDIDESCLFMSSDNGLIWDKVADKGEFGWNVNDDGRVQIEFTR